MHASTEITDYIYNNANQGEVTCIVALDLKRAFDRVCPEALANKLSWYNIDNSLIFSFMSNRYQLVETKTFDHSCIQSKLRGNNIGAPQGSCLSCLLFSIFINGLPNCVPNSKIVLFAEDNYLPHAFKPNQKLQAIVDIETDLSRINSWMRDSCASLKINKTELMLCGFQHLLRKIGNFEIIILR